MTENTPKYTTNPCKDIDIPPPSPQNQELYDMIKTFERRHPSYGYLVGVFVYEGYKLGLQHGEDNLRVVADWQANFILKWLGDHGHKEIVRQLAEAIISVEVPFEELTEQ